MFHFSFYEKRLVYMVSVPKTDVEGANLPEGDEFTQAEREWLENFIAENRDEVGNIQIPKNRSDATSEAWKYILGEMKKSEKENVSGIRVGVGSGIAKRIGKLRQPGGRVIQLKRPSSPLKMPKKPTPLKTPATPKKTSGKKMILRNGKLVRKDIADSNTGTSAPQETENERAIRVSRELMEKRLANEADQKAKAERIAAEKEEARQKAEEEREAARQEAEREKEEARRKAEEEEKAAAKKRAEEAGPDYEKAKAQLKNCDFTHLDALAQENIELARDFAENLGKIMQMTDEAYTKDVSLGKLDHFYYGKMWHGLGSYFPSNLGESFKNCQYYDANHDYSNREVRYKRMKAVVRSAVRGFLLNLNKGHNSSQTMKEHLDFVAAGNIGEASSWGDFFKAGYVDNLGEEIQSDVELGRND